MADAKAGRPLTSSASTPGGSSSSSSYSASRIDWEERKRNWGKAGVLGLRDLGLSLLEEQVFQSIEGTVKVADLSLNKLLALPGSIGGLTSLHTLKLSKNALTTEGVPWAALYRLPLKMLALDVNQLRVRAVAGCFLTLLLAPT